MKIAEHVVFRFESKIKDGTLFVFDLQDYRLLKGGIVEYDILKKIKIGLTKQDITQYISENYSINGAKEQVDGFIDFLQQAGIIHVGNVWARLVVSSSLLTAVKPNNLRRLPGSNWSPSAAAIGVTTRPIGLVDPVLTLR